jgi:hypothetical protein
MSEPHENEQPDHHEPEHVAGVDTDPHDGKKQIAVDTNERLEKKDKNLEEVPEDQLERERQERLDPDKRPDNVEVDNSQRTFNPETGLFEDTDLEPPAEAPFPTESAEG